MLKSARAHKQNKKWINTLTSSCALPEELLNSLCLDIVAVVFCYHGTQLTKLSEEAVLVLRVTKLGGQGAALAAFGR